MVTPAVRREAVAHLTQDYEVSQRRACDVLGAARSVVRYVRQRADDITLRSRLRELAHERKRFGYRRLHQMLRREGTAMNLRSYGGFTLKNGCKCASVEVVKEPLEAAHP